MHYDLKGAHPRADYLKESFRLAKQLGATGVLIEWEDVFPWDGALRDIKNRNAYSLDEAREIIRL